jgi:hypothetical protein
MEALICLVYLTKRVSCGINRPLSPNLGLLERIVESNSIEMLIVKSLGVLRHRSSFC